MTAVWRDLNQIWVEGEIHTYAPQTLVALVEGDRIGVRLKGSALNIIWEPYGALHDGQGTGFDSAEAAYAYLARIFSEPADPVSSATAEASAEFPAGLPLAVSRVDQRLIPARADTYVSAFVAGLATTDVLAGHAGSATREALTLPDWTPVTGAQSLAQGVPYFLGISGGLTLTPDRTSGLCLVRVGIATGPQTLVPTISDPVLQ